MSSCSEARRATTSAGCGAAQPRAGGEPWTHKEIGNAVRRTAEQAGLPKEVTPHTSRHSFGTR
ncbi:hypothetical protein G6O69_12085 [Pseudenhygromyxa sp. WMMC2535]|uniref:hypothetical protein n=1 Tax=Pseudenhygromyxa sp. WMMC2535 TaxID=2712867 RepID=UPI0015950495|nr:hypothetical protein [Pseudenhygromyxa sp. WMMC2535]NVB38572.1 hypothetical protein [Pseudenhygromyxa sp. WMMC2535]